MVNLCYAENKKNIKLKQTRLHLKVLLNWCLSWSARDWYFPDWHVTKEKMETFSVDLYFHLLVAVRFFDGFPTHLFGLPADTSLPRSFLALGCGSQLCWRRAKDYWAKHRCDVYQCRRPEGLLDLQKQHKNGGLWIITWRWHGQQFIGEIIL